MERAVAQPTTRASRKAPRRRARRLAFAALLVSALAAGQELLFRGLFPLPEVVGFNRVRYQMMAGAHPEFRATLRRGLVYDRLRFESRPDGFAEVHRLNLYGFRGPDFAIAAPRGRRRLLVVGDSVTEGQGASESATIPAELGRALDRDGEGAEVLNLGVVAATLPHLAALARDATALLRPTDVVLVVYANDLPAPPFPRDLDAPAPRFPPRGAPAWLPRAVELTGRAARGEPIYRRWPHAPIRFFAPVPDPTNPWSGSQGPPPGLDPALYRAMAEGAMNPWLKEQSEALPGMLAHDFATGGSPAPYLGRIGAWCRAAGATLVVAYVPFCGVVHPRYAAPLVALGMNPATAAGLSRDPAYRRQGAALAAACAGFGLPLADATADLAAAEARGVPQFWEYDTHPRPAGYATIARRIRDVMRRPVGGPTPRG